MCADMEEAFAEYKEWLGGSVDAEVEKAYNRALDTLQKVKPFEEQLVRVFRAVLEAIQHQQHGRLQHSGEKAQTCKLCVASSVAAWLAAC